MNSHNFHPLIAAIDRILPKVNTSVSQLTPNDLLEMSFVLEQVRSYLVALESQNSSAKIGTSAQQSVTRQVVDAVGQKIASLGSNLIKPLQTEVEILQQQKSDLTSEIREMEALRQQYYSVEQPAIQQKTKSEFSPPITKLLHNLAGSFPGIHPHEVKKTPQGGKFPYPSTKFISTPITKPLGLGLTNPKFDLKNQPATPKIQSQPDESNQFEDHTPEIEEIDLYLASQGVQPIDESDLDRFLHDEIAALTSSALVEDALGGEEGAQDADVTTKNIESIANIATISQLTDLVPADASSISVKPEPNSGVLLSQLLTVDPDSAVTVEDNYILASPKEYLIPNNEPSIQSDIKHFLPQDTLQKLTEDLSMFEWCERQTFSEQPPTPIVDLIAKAPTEVTILRYRPRVLPPDQDFDLDLFHSEPQRLDEDLSEETLINNPFTLDPQEDFSDYDDYQIK